MAKKTIHWKIYPSDDESIIIDAAQKAARYKNRNRYILDAALLGTPLHLSEIASRLGELGLLCNELLSEDEQGQRHARLTRADSKRAVDHIVIARDAVIDALRGA